MRIQLAILCAVLSIGTAAADPDDLVTAPNAILCMSADSLETATAAPVAKARSFCRRWMPAFRSRHPHTHGADALRADSWQVRFYPAGMSGGVVLWGRPRRSRRRTAPPTVTERGRDGTGAIDSNYGTQAVGSVAAYSAIPPGVVTHTLSNPGCFMSVCRACRTCASRNG